MFSQEILWEKSLGGKHSDYLLDATPTADYGFILAGSSMSDKTGNKDQKNLGNLDFWLWKMNEKGDLDWQKSIGGSGRDLLYSIANTNDGGFILGGTSESNATEGIKKENCRGNEDYWVIKLDAKGEIQWEKTLGGKGQDILTKVISTSNGYLLAGSSNSNKSDDKEKNNLGGLDFWIVKLDNEGSVEWERTFGGEYQDILRSAIQTNDEGYLLGGYTNSPASDYKMTDNLSGDYWVIKLNKAGNIEWEQTFGGEENDDLHILLQTQDGNFLIGGHSSSPPAKNGSDIWLIKTDYTGRILWQQNYDIGTTDLLTSLIENEDGTLIAGINAKGSKLKKKKEGVDDYLIKKLSATGEEIWTKSIGSLGKDILRKAVMTRDGGYLLAGMSNSTKSSQHKKNNIGRNDFWVVKLRDEDKPKEDKLTIEAFPNPTAQYTNIIIGYEYEKGTCTVFDLGGRQLQSFAIVKERTVPVNLDGLPEGIYIIEIRTNVQKDGVKVIKGITKK